MRPAKQFRLWVSWALLNLLTYSASAAISSGPVSTNKVLASQKLNDAYFEAQQSDQERLKVGRKRYAEQQANRAKVIAAMTASRQAREQTVFFHPPASAFGNETVTGAEHSIVIEVISFIVAAGVFWRAALILKPKYKRRPAPPPLPKPKKQPLPRLPDGQIVPANRLHLLD